MWFLPTLPIGIFLLEEIEEPFGNLMGTCENTLGTRKKKCPTFAPLPTQNSKEKI
jgi:hypothetical protein